MDFSRALDTMKNMWYGITAGLPDFVLAVLIFLLFYFIAKRIRHLVARMTDQRRRGKTLGVVLGKLAQGGVIMAGVLIALTVVFPSFQPNDLIQLLGIGSVAIGFAFHDLFQNFLAGILLLLTSPFHIGDQIIVKEFEGTVEDIEMRATTIKTYDGRRIVIPNTDLFTNSVVVNTAFQKRRLEYVISVDYENDIDEVKRIILEAVAELDGILNEPPPQTLVVGLSEASIDIHVEWWTKAHRQDDVLYLQDKVLTTLKKRLTSRRIAMPTTTQHVVLLSLPDTTEQVSPDTSEVLADGKYEH